MKKLLNHANEKKQTVAYYNSVMTPVPVQSKCISRHCKIFKLHVNCSYFDYSVDGRRDMFRRPGMQRLLKDVCGGQVSEVIVSKMNVVSFSIDEVFDFALHLKSRGVNFISAQENFNANSFLGSYILELWSNRNKEKRVGDVYLSRKLYSAV